MVCSSSWHPAAHHDGPLRCPRAGQRSSCSPIPDVFGGRFGNVGPDHIFVCSSGPFRPEPNRRLMARRGEAAHAASAVE
jgi:hypothetical protein